MVCVTGEFYISNDIHCKKVLQKFKQACVKKYQIFLLIFFENQQNLSYHYLKEILW
jgi:hypothetical protein